MRRLLLTSLAAAALAAAAGCGDDDTDTGSTASAAPTTEATPSTPAPAAADAEVDIGMRGLQFEPEDVTVKVGSKVVWTNLEDIPHNVVAQEGADFESDTFGKDGTFTFEAGEAAAISYVCTIHPGMEGTLTVEE